MVSSPGGLRGNAAGTGGSPPGHPLGTSSPAVQRETGLAAGPLVAVVAVAVHTVVAAVHMVVAAAGTVVAAADMVVAAADMVVAAPGMVVAAVHMVVVVVGMVVVVVPPDLHRCPSPGQTVVPCRPLRVTTAHAAAQGSVELDPHPPPQCRGWHRTSPPASTSCPSSSTSSRRG